MDSLSSALGQIEGTYESLKSVASSLTSSLVFNNDNSIDKLKTELEAAIGDLETAVANAKGHITTAESNKKAITRGSVKYVE